MKYIKLLSAALAVIFFCSCGSVSDRIATEMPKVRQEWNGAFEIAKSDQATMLINSWDEAVQLILENNIDLRAAVEDAQFAERECGMVYRRLLPEIVFTGGLNKSIGEVGTLSYDDVFLLANGFVQLPNPIEVKVRALSAQLFEIRSDLGGQMLLRELYGKVYRLQRKQLTIDDNSSRLQELDNLIEALNNAAPERASDIALQANKLRIENRLAYADLQTELGELFGDATHYYRFTEEFEAPILNYAGSARTYESLETYGELYSTSAAARLVGMNLTELGVSIDQWPRLRAYATLPSLWTQRSGNNDFADFDSTQVGINLTWTTDFRGERKLRKDRLASENEIQRAKISQAVQSEANMLVTLQKEATAIHSELIATVKQLDALEPFRNSEVRAIRIKTIDKANNLKATKTALEERIAEINLTFWLLDDSQWQGISDYKDGIFALKLETK